MLEDELAEEVQKAHWNIRQSDCGQDDTELDAFIYLLLVALLIVGYIIALILRYFHSRYVHESAMFIILGGATGFIIFFTDSSRLESVITFDPETFFLFLLPPIIFESGYNMNKSVFFKNFASITSYAFLGTIFSTIIVALGIYLFQYIYDFDLTLAECVTFGSLISATDPVTVLAIFKEAQVHEDLYSNVFGEAVLNDAVALVLYTTSVGFIHSSGDTTDISMIHGIMQFLLIFVGSLLVGIVVGLLSSILLKFTPFYTFPTLEFAMIILYAYSSYLLAEALQLSGIVAILFCGIIMAHYTRKNLSKETKEFSHRFFETIAVLAETFVFLYLGLSIFYALEDFSLALAALSIILCLIGRAANIFPLSFIINAFKKRGCPKGDVRIPYNHQTMLWFSGLRGAMAFALAIDLNTQDSKNGPLLLSTTMSVVLFTVFIFGSFTSKTLELLKIPVGEAARPSTPSPLKKESRFIRWDRLYIVPLITRMKPAASRADVEFVSETSDVFKIDDTELDSMDDLDLIEGNLRPPIVQ